MKNVSMIHPLCKSLNLTNILKNVIFEGQGHFQGLLMGPTDLRFNVNFDSVRFNQMLILPLLSPLKK